MKFGLEWEPSEGKVTVFREEEGGERSSAAFWLSQYESITELRRRVEEGLLEQNIAIPSVFFRIIPFLLE